jgi:hypothetical protein
MNRRNMLTTLGATVLGASALFGGAASTFAQDASTPPAAGVEVQDPHAEFEAERAKAYDDFVAALATELGDDKAKVDAAIRAALIQSVDAKLAAGEIDEERAAAAKAVIQVSDAPLMAGFGGPGGHHSFKGRGGRGHRHGGPGFGDERGGKSQSRQGENRSTSSLPAAPAAAAASAQGVIS